MQDVTTSSILTKTLFGAIWGTSVLVKCTGDILSWCGTQGLNLTKGQQPNTNI